MDQSERIPEKEKEDFWLEIGPSSAYAGLECYGSALENGDASPDGKRLGWTGAEPPHSPADAPEDAAEDAAKDSAAEDSARDAAKDSAAEDSARDSANDAAGDAADGSGLRREEEDSLTLPAPDPLLGLPGGLSSLNGLPNAPTLFAPDDIPPIDL